MNDFFSPFVLIYCVYKLQDSHITKWKGYKESHSTYNSALTLTDQMVSVLRMLFQTTFKGNGRIVLCPQKPSICFLHNYCLLQLLQQVLYSMNYFYHAFVNIKWSSYHFMRSCHHTKQLSKHNGKTALCACGRTVLTSCYFTLSFEVDIYL